MAAVFHAPQHPMRNLSRYVSVFLTADRGCISLRHRMGKWGCVRVGVACVCCCEIMVDVQGFSSGQGLRVCVCAGRRGEERGVVGVHSGIKNNQEGPEEVVAVAVTEFRHPSAGKRSHHQTAHDRRLSDESEHVG